MCSANVILLFRGWEFIFEVMNQGVIEEVVFNASAAEQEVVFTGIKKGGEIFWPGGCHEQRCGSEKAQGISRKVRYI